MESLSLNITALSQMEETDAMGYLHSKSCLSRTYLDLSKSEMFQVFSGEFWLIEALMRMLL